MTDRFSSDLYHGNYAFKEKKASLKKEATWHSLERKYCLCRNVISRASGILFRSLEATIVIYVDVLC